MTIHHEDHSAIEIAQIVTTIPMLFAALIGAIPLMAVCLTCRCCKGACVKLVNLIRKPGVPA